MNIKQKFVLPLIIIGIISGIIGYLILNIQIRYLHSNSYLKLATMKQNQIYSMIDYDSKKAVEIASIFTKLPIVIKAFEIAHSGDITNENDTKLAQARQLLRDELKYHLIGYERIINNKMKLHFHLPNGRSLVRLWRKKQTLRNGLWYDISDDISSFRNTVLDVNRLGEPLNGIELGRGGFVIRGLAPIKSKDNKILGSVEILHDFNVVLQNILQYFNEFENQCIYLFMNYDELSITTKLQDIHTNPIFQDKYVFVYGTKPLMDSNCLDAKKLDIGKKGLYVIQEEDKIHSVFPIKDYKNKQIGVLQYIFNKKDENILSRYIVFTQLSIIIFILIIVGISLFLMISKIIVKPVSRVVAISTEIAKGDLSKNIQEKRSDEMGLLFNSNNYMINELRKIVIDVKFTGKKLVSASGNMNKNINTIASATEEISVNVQNISDISNQLSSNIDTIYGSIENMTSSIGNVGDTAKKGAHISNKAVKMSEKAGQAMNSLGDSANEIGQVTEVIKKISDKTSLLALNAHIEAASAGDAGKGFAVVANEIKDFAQQSTRAAEDITCKITSMQENTKEAVGVIQQVIDIISSINISTEKIFSELSNQVHTANDITRNIDQAKTRARDIAFSMMEIAQGTTEVSKSVGIAARGMVEEDFDDCKIFHSSAALVEKLANDLLKMVEKFKT